MTLWSRFDAQWFDTTLLAIWISVIVMGVGVALLGSAPLLMGPEVAMIAVNVFVFLSCGRFLVAMEKLAIPLMCVSYLMAVCSSFYYMDTAVTRTARMASCLLIASFLCVSYVCVTPIFTLAERINKRKHARIR